jgi:hypothetical protein
VDGRRGAVVKPKPGVICRQLGDTAVLVDLSTNQIFELNRTGSRIWELLGEGVRPEGIAERLQQEFDVDAERADKEVDELVMALKGNRLITE